MDWELLGLATLLAVAIVLAVGALVAAAQYLSKAEWVDRLRAEQGAWRRERELRRPLHAFPVQPLNEMPGRFKVWGVMRETEEEVEWEIDAKLRANAVAKAELRGMVVTKVERLPDAVPVGPPNPDDPTTDAPDTRDVAVPVQPLFS